MYHLYVSFNIDVFRVNILYDEQHGDTCFLNQCIIESMTLNLAIDVVAKYLTQWMDTHLY